VFATAAFIVAWIVAYYVLRRKDGFLRTATIIFIVLTVLGYIGTFPTFFEAFE
jgi:cytochrome bd-type quinol oxidase subunit 1